MKILVTGATGFLGSHLLRYLVEHGHNIAILIRETSNTWRISDLLTNKQVNIIYGSMQFLNIVKTQINEFSPEVVYHLAWQGGNSSIYQEDPGQIYNNLDGTLELIRISNECGVKAWIGMGSVVEYGEFNGIFNEEMLPQPTTLYGLSKYTTGLLTEKLCAIYGMRFVWVRPFWIYGPYDDGLRLIPYVILSLYNKKNPKLTLGVQKWDYLYIDDAIRALYALGKNYDAHGIYNLGSGQSVILRDLIGYIRDKIDSKILLDFGTIPYKKGQIMHLQADVNKIKNDIKWNPETPINAGLDRTVKWFMKYRNLYDTK